MPNEFSKYNVLLNLANNIPTIFWDSIILGLDNFGTEAGEGAVYS